mgnify:FL=1|tara:strand:+ start:3340 stop:4512 length:1173 start_codon:yes stop_codon:yes gene_type:complete
MKFNQRNIYLYYSGGLKREISIINNLLYDFKKINLITIDTKVDELEKKKNLYIKKFKFLKIIVYICNLIKLNKFISNLIHLFTLYIIDFFFAFHLFFSKAKKGDIIVCENNICLMLLKVAKYKKIVSLLDVSNTNIVDKYNKIVNSRGYKLNFIDKYLIKKAQKEYNIANYISVLSTTAYKSFQKYSSSNMGKIKLINSGIDVNNFKNILDYKNYSLCIVGAISKYKNSHKIFKCLNNIKDFKLNILVIGNFDKTMNSIDLPNHKVKHIPFVEQNELSTYYSKSIMLCIVSYIEGMPKVVLEAGACGLPVIGFNSSSINDIITDNYNGYIVNDDDYDDFADKVKLILSNKDKQIYLSKNASTNINNNFNLKTYASRWNESIVQILNEYYK